MTVSAERSTTACSGLTKLYSDYGPPQNLNRQLWLLQNHKTVAAMTESRAYAEGYPGDLSIPPAVSLVDPGAAHLYKLSCENHGLSQ